MKKILILALILVPISVYGEENNTSLAENATSAIIIESSTGEILFEKNSNEKLPPASMTKIMTMLLIMENIDSGNIKWDEEVTASEFASSMGGSQIFLEAGEVMSVEELLKAIAIASGNDAAVAMAEKISGTEEEFVKLMNKRANEMGLKNTNFKNVTGLEEENHYSSAHDMAIMASYLVKYPKILEFTGTYEAYLREDTDNKFWLVNTNKLVRFYQGVDGLKTGYTSEAGYCLTATAKKNDMRIITVVMKEPDSNTRNSETTEMLNYAFGTYKVNNIISTKNVITSSSVILGKKENTNIVVKEDINILSKKTTENRNITYDTEIYDIKAPVRKGDTVGKLYLLENNKRIDTYDLTVSEDIEKANIFNIFLRNLKNILSGQVNL